MKITLEYLQMTEEDVKGNLTYKLEVFFNSCILHGWKDSIVTLQSTNEFSLWERDDESCNGAESQRNKSPSKGWWAEDMAELGINLYWRTMIAVKSGGKMPSSLIEEALNICIARWKDVVSPFFILCLFFFFLS
ncbi:hypothetical protein NC653_004188 [Populus alba x Populus x berolinensis]|uniref:NPH3 domain-containing protein n=1 Tax=Populus alba x Populus x berolinensis TaxID=444605 RepID=A0AAD6WJG2_9ROSI|nr:hypothetical protein NC653_004188 [Populus alba x Populus x berolinensis]